MCVCVFWRRKERLRRVREIENENRNGMEGEWLEIGRGVG